MAFDALSHNPLFLGIGHSFLQGLVLGTIMTEFVMCDPNMLMVSNCILDVRGFRLFCSGAC